MNVQFWYILRPWGVQTISQKNPHFQIDFLQVITNLFGLIQINEHIQNIMAEWEMFNAIPYETIKMQFIQTIHFDNCITICIRFPVNIYFSTWETHLLLMNYDNG